VHRKHMPTNKLRALLRKRNARPRAHPANILRND
jgi:hypothetical protein